MDETETLEFKKTTSEINEGMISIASILNKHKKGTLYFGRKNDGTPVKFQISDSTLRDVSRKIYESIKPQIFPTIGIEIIDGIDTIKVEFSGDDAPYSAFGKYYIRVSDEDRELTPSELRKIMISKEYEEHWENKSTNETIVDIENRTLKKFYDDAIKSGRMALIDYDEKSILNILNLMNGNFLTNAGKVLFSKNKPLTLNLFVFATKERLTILDSIKIKGNIFELIDEAMNFIVKNIRWKVEINGSSLQRYEIPEVPLVALREAIINSFAHARYDGNVEHEIDIYSNRISIINPGCFANDFEPIDFYKRQLKSYLRNNVISDVLYMCKDVETCGHGLKKIYTSCNESKVSINYINEENDFTFEFSRVDRNGEINGEINDEIKNQLSEKEYIVLIAIKDNPNIIKEELIGKTNLSSRTIDRVIMSLKQKKLIKRMGSNKKGYWEVINK